jgi:hypothetical protein
VFDNAVEGEWLAQLQVRKTPSWPRSWANVSLFFKPYSHRNAHGSICIFWANLKPFSRPGEVGAGGRPRARALGGGVRRQQ